MKIRDINSYFQTVFPSERSCSWDNDGLLLCPDLDREVTSVVTCLDVTFPVIEKAIAYQSQLIVSHHPLIFSPIDRLTEESIVGQKIFMMMEARISLISLHTRLDGAVGGLNDRFGEMIGVLPERYSPLLEEEPYIGAIGRLSERLSPEEFAKRVSSALETPVKLYSAGTDLERIGYCCGSGKDLVFPCIERGVDAFVGGDISYHVALEAVERGVSVIDCGHHSSEKEAANLLCEVLTAFDPILEIHPEIEFLGGEFIGKF